MALSFFILVLLHMSTGSAQFSWRKLQPLPPNTERRINIQSDFLTTHQSNSTTVEDETIVLTAPPPPTTTSNTPVLRPRPSNSRNPMGYQRPGQAQFGHLFGRVTPVRIEQTLHELTTKKGLDDVGAVSRFSLFHGGRKTYNLNLSRVANSFMQKVTSNYIKGLRKTKQPELVKRKVKDSGEDIHSLVLESRELGNDYDGLINNTNMIDDDVKPPSKIMDNRPEHSTELKNQNIELENDLQTGETEINNVDQDEGKRVDDEISHKVLAIANGENEQDTADVLSEYGDNIAFFNVPLQQPDSGDILPVESRVLNSDFIKSTYELEQEIDIIDAVENSNIHLDQENEIIDTLEDSNIVLTQKKYIVDAIEDSNFHLEQDRKIIDTLEDSNIGLEKNNYIIDPVNDSNISLEQENYIVDPVEDSFMELEQENDIIEDVEDSNIPPFDYNIGKAPPKTEIDILEKIDIHLNDKNLSEASYPSDIIESALLNKEDKDSYGTALGPIIMNSYNIEEEQKPIEPEENYILYIEEEEEEQKPEENENYETFGSPLSVFDSFGEDTFSNARFRIPAQFRKILQQPPAWLNTNKW